MAHATEAERAKLGELLARLAGVCRFCGCNGECCTTVDPGEKCVLVGDLGTRCNGISCEHKYYAEQRQVKRQRKRKGRRAA